jgi:hypothetical protein
VRLGLYLEYNIYTQIEYKKVTYKKHKELLGVQPENKNSSSVQFLCEILISISIKEKEHT